VVTRVALEDAYSDALKFAREILPQGKCGSDCVCLHSHLLICVFRSYCYSYG
jgi:hypothetical protein